MAEVITQEILFDILMQALNDYAEKNADNDSEALSQISHQLRNLDLNLINSNQTIINLLCLLIGIIVGCVFSYFLIAGINSWKR